MFKLFFFWIFIGLIPPAQFSIKKLLLAQTYFLKKLFISFQRRNIEIPELPESFHLFFTSLFKRKVLRYYKLDFLPPAFLSQSSIF